MKTIVSGIRSTGKLHLGNYYGALRNFIRMQNNADNLRRISQIIAAMDVPGSTEMEAIPLQYAIASDLAPMVQRFAEGGTVGGAPGGAGASQANLVMADSRTNTLMVRAANPARLNMLKGLITRLDRPGNGGLGGSGINVVYLKNADAVKLAQVLRAAFPGAGGSGGGAAAGGSSSPAPTTPTASTTSNSSSATSTGSSGSSQQSSTPVSASAGPSTGGFIQADPATNSLIITAPDALYRQLRSVIDQLDGRRAQIYIESMIVEVNAEKMADLGVQWQGVVGSQGDKNVIGIGTNLPISNKVTGLLNATATVAGGAAPALLGGLNIGVVHDFGNGNYGLAALANFLQSKADGNILSTPNLVALDNEEAKIVIGQNVPFPTGSYTNNNSSNGSVNPFTTVERKDVGLTLRVRPQVGEGGTVRMTVYQENSGVVAGTTNAPNGPTTSKSSIETTVIVDDKSLLVLGGLIQETMSVEQTKVPLLGDAPLIGQLFRSESRERKKTNLMVFLRPVVMRTEEASSALTLDRYDYMRSQQSGAMPDKRLLLPVDGGPMLPSLKFTPGMLPPLVQQPLDDPLAPAPTIVMPVNSGYVPRLTGDGGVVVTTPVAPPSASQTRPLTAPGPIPAP